MKTTLILKNNGKDASVGITLQVSYFVKVNDKPQVKAKEFVITLENHQETIQEVEFDNSAIEELEVLILVQKTKGNIITQKSFILKDILNQRPAIEFTIDKEIDPGAVPDANVEPARPNFVYGRLLDIKGVHKMEDIQIIISAKKEDTSDFEPITSVKTEAQGYFSIDYPVGEFKAATALVGLELSENPIPIKLDEKKIKIKNENGEDAEKTITVFPQRVILIAELKENLVPTEVGNGDCGCNADDFEEKRVLEEFSFFSLVRTSQPAIKGYILEDEDEITLEDVLKRLPFSIFEVMEPLRTLPVIARTSPVALTKTTGTNNPRRNNAADDDAKFLETIKTIKIKKSVLNNFLKDEKVINKDNISNLLARNEAFLLQDFFSPKPPPPKPLGRVELGLNNSIDWDDEPTIYQAIEIAHGHLLHYKTEWIADGYSLGDLLYSLPLAPGQKKQIVVFDWERRESASNIQSVDYEESLFNSLTRDRDILEIAKGTIHESVRGSSTASVGAVGGGIGGFFGVVFGVAGGYSTAKSKASQNSFRQVSSSDQQKLSDKIVQSANAVRSMRSTVIQTVSQGERFEVSSESVANYNHCHALTIQYYEVLRHFKIRQRFASARECLFVPLLMSQFDVEKALRWREPLQAALIDKRLAAGFDAGDRVSHQWKDSNFPSGTFASESIITASGVLHIRFVLQRPIDDIVEVDDTDRSPAYSGSTYSPPVWHKKKVSRIIPANWEKLKPFLGGLSPEEFHRDYIENARDKDAVFHQMVGEKVAQEFIKSLVFEVKDDQTPGTVGSFPIDASVTSRYARNGMLNVSLRLNQPTSFAREKVHYLCIKSSINAGSNLGGILSDGSFMTVQSGFMRYKTKHFDGFLFKYQYLGDDLTETDGVTIYAGPSSDELKDPRKEDLVILNRLIAHLNDNLEHYHKAIWLSMTPERRFMLLDGIILNGKGEGKSVASLVENDLLTIVGNSLVFPVAPGLNLNPDFGMERSLDDFYMTAAADPVSVSVPTKGVFAEAVMGKCNSCEKMEEDRFWRWEESPIPDSPTAINPISTDTRRSEPGNLQPQPLPNPMINIQNAPDAPAPAGLAGTLGLLGQSNIFKDITGLEGNQRNAMQAFQSSLDTAKTFAQEAGKLEVQKAMEKRLDKAINAIDNDKSLTPEKKAELKEKAINAYLGGGATKEEPKDKSPNKPTIKDAAIKAIEKGQPVKTSELDKEGNSMAVEVGSTSQSTAATPQKTYINATPEERTFNPPYDKSGIAKINIDNTYASDNSYIFHWGHDGEIVTPGDPGVGHLSTGSRTFARTKTLEIWSGRPGIYKIQLEIQQEVPNTTPKTYKYIDSQFTVIGVPQFVVVSLGSISTLGDGTPYIIHPDSKKTQVPNATTFDGALKRAKLNTRKDIVIKKTKDVCERLLSFVNVRIIWNIPDSNGVLLEDKNLLLAKLKANFPIFESEYVTNISLNGYSPQEDEALFGRTYNTSAHTHNEKIDIFPGDMIFSSYLNTTAANAPDMFLRNIYKLTKALDDAEQSLQSTPNDTNKKQEFDRLLDLWTEVFSRILGHTMAHEICHSLLGFAGGLDITGHTPTGGASDLLIAFPKSVEEATGIMINEKTFPAVDSYVLPTSVVESIIADIRQLSFSFSNDSSLKAKLDSVYAVPPTPPFDK